MRINMCIEESEAAFLESDLQDLINVGGAADRGLGKLVPFAERVVMAAYKSMTFTKKVSSSKYKQYDIRADARAKALQSKRGHY